LFRIWKFIGVECFSENKIFQYLSFFTKNVLKKPLNGRKYFHGSPLLFRKSKATTTRINYKNRLTPKNHKLYKNKLLNTKWAIGNPSCFKDGHCNKKKILLFLTENLSFRFSFTYVWKRLVKRAVDDLTIVWISSTNKTSGTARTLFWQVSYCRLQIQQFWIQLTPIENLKNSFLKRIKMFLVLMFIQA